MPDLLDRFGVLLLGCLECLLLGEGGEESDFFRHLLYCALFILCLWNQVGLLGLLVVYLSVVISYRF